mgnify:CR=1 FL=1
MVGYYFSYENNQELAKLSYNLPWSHNQALLRTLDSAMRDKYVNMYIKAPYSLFELKEYQYIENYKLHTGKIPIIPDDLNDDVDWN